jgi:hypothetical protein
MLGSLSSATLKIIDNDVSLSFSAAAYSVSEGGKNATITIIRRGAKAQAVSVKFATADGTAQAAKDYRSVKRTVYFFAGETTKKVYFPIIDNSRKNPAKTVALSLTAPSPGTMLGSPSSATLTIRDNDHRPTIYFPASNFRVNEGAGKAEIKIFRRFCYLTTAVSVTVQTAGGTATAGSDYKTVEKIVYFPKGTQVKTISIPIIDDSITEQNETVKLSLSAPSPAAVLGKQRDTVLTIVDND